MNPVDHQLWYRSRTEVSGEMSEPLEQNITIGKNKSHSPASNTNAKSSVSTPKNPPKKLPKSSKKSLEPLPNLNPESENEPPHKRQRRKRNDSPKKVKFFIQSDPNQSTVLENTEVLKTNRTRSSKKQAESIQENKEKPPEDQKIEKVPENKNNTKPAPEKLIKKSEISPKSSQSSEPCTNPPVTKEPRPSPDPKTPKASNPIFKCPNLLCTLYFSTSPELLSHIKSIHSLCCKMPYCTFTTFSYKKFMSHFQLIHCSDTPMPKKRRGRQPSKQSEPEKLVKI